MQSNKNSGFTLVELAIVLIVVGLLVAIVAAGKNIVAAGQVRAVIKEVEEIQSSFIRFKEKYLNLPGDIPDASAYFGCTAGSPPAGCDGNGDEDISWNTGAGAGAFHEGALAFYHLQQAKMLGGDPLNGQGGLAQPGINIPSSKITNAGWLVMDFTGVPGFPSTNGLLLGGESIPAIALNITPILEPKNAFSIDDKLDDGTSDSGRVRGLSFPPTTGCDSGGAYLVSDNRKLCIMTFQLDTEL